MTDAGVPGEGTQSANALLPNSPAMNNAISQRLNMCESNFPTARFVATALPRKSCAQLKSMCELTKGKWWGLRGNWQNGSVIPRPKGRAR